MKKYISLRTLLLLFSREKHYVLNLTKSGLCHILGNFFTQTSGHPAASTPLPTAAATTTTKTNVEKLSGS
jgi:hypothetical protein